MQPHDIGDLNVERLVGASYKPEQPDPQFVAQLHARLQAAARSRAPAQQPDQEHLRKIRRRLGWAMALAACVAGVALLLRAADRPEAAKKDQPRNGSEAKVVNPDAPRAVPWGGEVAHGLTPRDRSAAVEEPKVTVGTTLNTKAGERRRVTLADGSVLYLNSDTEAKYVAERRVRLVRGELYVEVSPRPEGPTFVVQAPDRSIEALGTRFNVWTEAAKSGVAVTQGTVQVGGVETVLLAGQQLQPGGKTPEPAPRASFVLDWTRELMIAAESPLVPCSEHAGGALIALDPNGQSMRLSLRKFHVDVHIEDGFARTTIDQTYFNETYGRLEGTFYFPLPADASLSRLAMYVQDGSECRLMEGGMAEREHARNVFETIMHMRRDPALLEWVDGSTFKMRVFPLEPRQEKRLILSYTQKVSTLYGTTRYRFPAGHSFDVVNDWSFEARVKHGAKLKCSSSSHPNMTVRTDGTDAVIFTKEKFATLKNDVTLDIHDEAAVARSGDRATAKDEDVARFSTFTHEGAQYLMLRYRPKLASQPKRERRDWVFLYESSANRDPILARAQLDTIRELLENAEHNDTFMLVAAGTRVHLFDKKIRTATRGNIKEAVKFLESVHLIGAMDLGQALAAVEPTLATAANPYLVHVGAGIPTIGERNDGALVKKIPLRAKYIGVGVGKQWNRALMKQAADRTGGYFTQINPDEPINWRAFELLATLNTPRLLDVRVVDNDEKVPFLTDATTLSQGEEICAVARIDAANESLPTSIVFTGTLDGKQVVKELKVEKLAGGAGYLPRQWAKLELDRLIAQDVEKNKAKIIGLSMQSYVMSPYTSLLVLETEADYAKYNVDRGRKDHWAMYKCPARIPLVYEPNNVPQAKGEVKGGNADVDSVLASILVRTPPQIVQSTTYPNPGWPATWTAQQLYQGAALVPEEEEVIGKVLEWLDRPTAAWKQFDTYQQIPDVALKKLTFKLNLATSPYLNLLRGGSLGLNYYDLKTTTGKTRDDKGMVGDSAKQGQQKIPTQPWMADQLEQRLVQELKVKFDKRAIEVIRDEIATKGGIGGPGGFGGGMAGGGGFGGGGFGPGGGPGPGGGFGPGGFGPGGIGGTRLGEFPPLGDPVDRFDKFGKVDPSADFKKRPPTIGSGSGKTGEKIPDIEELTKSKARTVGKDTNGIAPRELDGLIYGYLAQTQQPRPYLYDRFQYTGDARTFSDLLWYAPAMNTTEADILATLEAEATPEPSAEPGTIDARARKLIDMARTGTWYALKVDAHGRQPAFAIYFNGAGQFTWDRVLANGLREQMICDGKTLWHLYPEIGVGSKRPLSRFHREELLALVPWLVPSADDMAHGRDVRLVDKHIVGLQPRGAEQARGEDGKPLPFVQINLVIDEGRLVERQLVVMPTKKVVWRQRFDGNGTITVEMPTSDQKPSSATFKVARAEAPSLQPRAKDLVVVPMPLRSHQHLLQKNNAGNWVDMLQKAPDDAIIEFIATEVALRNGDGALQLFGRRFAAKGDRRLGFYVLLAAAGYHVDRFTGYQWDNEPRVFFDMVADHPKEPLAYYLAYDLEITGAGDGKDRLRRTEMGDIGGPADGFVQRLGKFRDLLWQWHTGKPGDNKAAWAKLRLDTVTFLGQAPLPVYDWALLDAMHRQCKLIDPHLETVLADANKLFGEGSALAYSARYDAAITATMCNRPEDACRLFRQVYLDTVEAGSVPPIEATFRVMLLTPADNGPNYVDLMRRAGSILAKRGQPLQVLTLAWQARQFGDIDLANELLGQAVTLCKPGVERNLARLTAVQMFQQSGDTIRADMMLKLVLTEEPFNQSPALWRMASGLAAQRNQLARAVTCMEQAMEREFRDLPPVINLQAIRNDYASLLMQYQQVANALAILEKEPTREFLAKVVRAADRWRSLDPDPTLVCQLTARILQTVGADDLAWDYLTTPLGMKPNQAAPWLDLARTLQAEGHLVLADKAFAQAYDAEPTNAQILWDRAHNLLQAGRNDDARGVFQVLATGHWQDRFLGLQEQAKQHLSVR
jgi:ferric-dicitrate binding protein FerR (iron transport regulator)/predicted Zn-dependent protease